MTPEQRTDYIVDCIRDAASMYPEDAARFLAEHDAHHRTEVLAEAGLLPKADVVAWLVKKAREATPVSQLASKVERGAVRPDNLRTLPATGQDDTSTATADSCMPHRKFPCGHCEHDVCQDCARCCGCTCGATYADTRGEPGDVTL